MKEKKEEHTKLTTKELLQKSVDAMTPEQKKLYEGLKGDMRAVTREEVEQSRTDVHRFELPDDYMTEDSLKYFQSEDNKNKFVEKFWKGD